MSDRRRARGAAAAAAAAGPSAAVVAEEQASANPVSSVAVQQGLEAGAAAAAAPVVIQPIVPGPGAPAVLAAPVAGAEAAGGAGAVAPVVSAAAAATLESAMSQMLLRYPRRYKAAVGATSYVGPEVMPSPESIFDSRSGDLAAQWIYQTRIMLSEYQAKHRVAPRNARAAEPVLDAVSWALFYALAHYEYAAFLHAFWKGRRAPAIVRERARRDAANAEAASSQYFAGLEEVAGYLDPAQGNELQRIVAVIQEFPESAATFGLSSRNGVTIDINEAQIRKFVMSGPERDAFQMAGAPPLGTFAGETPVPPIQSLGLNRSSYFRSDYAREVATAPGRPIAMPPEGRNILANLGPDDIEVRAAAAIHGAILAAQRTAPGALAAAKEKVSQASQAVTAGLSRVWGYLRSGRAAAGPNAGAGAESAASAAAPAAQAPLPLLAPVAQRPALTALPGFMGAPGANAAPAGPVLGSKRRRSNNGVNALNEGGPSAAKEARRENGNNNSNNEGNQGGGRGRRLHKARRTRRSNRKSKTTRRQRH